MRRLFVVLILVLVAAPALAQAPVTIGPVLPGDRVEWNAPANVTTVAEALTFEARFYLDAVPATALTNVQCAPDISQILCWAPLSASNVDALNLVGLHELRLSLYRMDVGEGDRSDPFVLRSRAGVPIGVSITRPAP